MPKKTVKAKDIPLVKKLFTKETDYEILSSELEKGYERYVLKHIRNSTRTYDIGEPF